MKFDILKYLLEQEQQQEQMPPQNQVNPGGEPGSPAQEDQNIKADPFSSIIGKTVKNMKVEKVGPNSGRVLIYFSGINIPLIVSWANDKVVAYSTPSGDPIPL